MCNKRIGCLRQPANPIDQEQQLQALFGMGSPRTGPNSGSGCTPNSNDETPRVKFLCSFSGTILPRPQDGKLRYVGGETRIVSVPREIAYEELMKRMRDIFEGAAVMKYQQPDEDLDALVSVVNDDDVTNMMEEYDKLGSGDGFTRLRIFLFSHPDQDVPPHFVDGNEGDSEKRYVDALNNLSDGSEYGRQQLHESPRMGSLDEVHVAEQFFNMGVMGGLYNQRNYDMPLPQFDSQHVMIPQLQHQQSVPHRYNDMDAPWSPSYYSPRNQGHHDPRPFADFPSSPSSARYRMPFGEQPDNRTAEEYGRQQVIQQFPIEHQPHCAENVPWLPIGAISGDNAGFPGNILHPSSAIEGNNICEHCQMSFQRNQPQLEQSNTGNGFQQVGNPCVECLPHHEQGWIPHHHLNHRSEEPRLHASAAVRPNNHYIVNGTGMNIPIGHGSTADIHHAPSIYAHNDPRYARAGSELGNETFSNQAVAAGPHIQSHAVEERSVLNGNLPYGYGAENIYQGQHGHPPVLASWRNNQNPVHAYEVSSTVHQVNGSVNPGYLRSTFEGSSGFQNARVDNSPQVGGFDASSMLEYPHGCPLQLNPNVHNQLSVSTGPDPSPPEMVNLAASKELELSLPSLIIPNDRGPGNEPSFINTVRVEEKSILGVENKPFKELECYEVTGNSSLVQTTKVAGNKCAAENSVNCNPMKPAEEYVCGEKVGEKDLSFSLDAKISADPLSCLPELIASATKAALDGVEEVKERDQEHTDPAPLDNSMTKEATSNELDCTNAHGDLELDSDNENIDTSKIEPTKAEAEAIERGLQTIKNDDLEEIRELGSGTYGAVYHGKWKGSDVAIKRIKASCFAGKPSERERLIADFWKEALILSSLHHPNVVSFYGIVRDGPDGSLATVTEFMVNGSLKQFLRKKDRTIDRRKRLIIGMDAAFGMEYLHGKNIVHFDLKCENLLVNMRDPQRPVCKIGDLGLSKVKHHTLVSGGVRGTLPWMAPELLSGKSNMVSEKIDVYSFGVVMWELLTGDEPYADMHCASIIGGIVNNTLRPQVPTWCDPEWKSLMESCWASNPVERPSFSEISQRLRSMASAMNLK